MSLDRLTDDEREAVRQSLVALRAGRFLDEHDLETRIGVAPAAYDALVSAWPAVDDTDDDSDAALIINNALNEVCNGGCIPDARWPRWFTVPREAVRSAYRHWRTARGGPEGGVR